MLIPMTKPFVTRLPEPLKDRAQTRAAELGVSLNALMNIALSEYLDVEAYTRRPARPAASASSAHAPARTGPCPCGSGKKYKRCCGA